MFAAYEQNLAQLHGLCLYVSVMYISEDSIPGFKRQGSSGGQAATGDAVRPALREPQQQRPVGTGGGPPTLRCG